MKIRIGISAGGEDMGPEAMVALAQGISATGFDSLWLPEVDRKSTRLNSSHSSPSRMPSSA